MADEPSHVDSDVGWLLHEIHDSPAMFSLRVLVSSVPGSWRRVTFPHPRAAERAGSTGDMAGLKSELAAVRGELAAIRELLGAREQT